MDPDAYVRVSGPGYVLLLHFYIEKESIHTPFLIIVIREE
jgi:hypothetical protein